MPPSNIRHYISTQDWNKLSTPTRTALIELLADYDAMKSRAVIAEKAYDDLKRGKENIEKLQAEAKNE